MDKLLEKLEQPSSLFALSPVRLSDRHQAVCLLTQFVAAPDPIAAELHVVSHRAAPIHSSF